MFFSSLLEIDPDEARLVQEIFDLRRQGLGTWLIAKLLTLRQEKIKGDRHRGTGRKSRGEGQWGPSSVLAILKNSAYIGKMYWNKARFVEPDPDKCRSPINLKRPKSTTRQNPPAEWIEIPVDPIIGQEDWDAVQALMASASVMNPRRRKHEYLLLNKPLQCGVCGCGMSGYYEARRSKRRYRCTRRSHDTTNACNRSIDVDWIEAEAWNVVESLMENEPEYIRMEFEWRYAVVQREQSYHQRDLGLTEQKLKESQAKLQRSKDAYAAGHTSLDEFGERKAPVNHECARLERLKSDILEQLSREHRREGGIKAAVEFIGRVRSELPTSTLAEKRRVVEMLDFRVRYTDKAHWASCFYIPAE